MLVLINLGFGTTCHYSTTWWCSVSYFASNTGLHCLTFTGRNSDRRKKIDAGTNSSGTNILNTVNDVGISSDSVGTNRVP
jgi:hypothetical protein